MTWFCFCFLFFVNFTEVWNKKQTFSVRKTVQNHVVKHLVLTLQIHEPYFDDLVQDCSNSIANTLELLPFCAKPSIYSGSQLDHQLLGVVSLTIRELSKTFSRNLCIAKIAHLMIISSWNFVRVPKAITFISMFAVHFHPSTARTVVNSGNVYQW